MLLTGIKIGLGITGSFCTFSKIPTLIKTLIAEGADILPILSYNSSSCDTRFGLAEDFIEELKNTTGNIPITSLPEAEPIGPKNLIDLMLIFPCTGNTLAKITYAISDTPVLMATKSHLRNQKPVLLGISTNDGLGQNAKNIGTLLTTKHIFFIPFRQDNPEEKPNSLICNIDLAVPSILKALEEKQLQPILC